MPGRMGGKGGTEPVKAMIGFDREAAEYIISALKEDGEELDYSLMERVIF